MDKRLIQLNCTANWGSTGKIAEGIGKAAMARGWKSAIAFGRYENPSESKLLRTGTQKDIYLHYARHKIFDEEGLGSANPTKKLIKQIDEYSPDIIQLHNIHDHWLNYPLFFEYLAKRPIQIVWTFHDCWAFTGGCAHFENIGCDKWITANCSGKCPGLHRKSAQQFELRKKLFSKLNERLTIVCVSHWLENYVRQSFLKDVSKIVVLNNGINVNGVFKPKPIPRKKLILGVSNGWPPEKGLEDFIMLRKMLPDEFEITIVGLSKKQIESLPSGIIGIERTNSAEELANLYSSATVFVNPTHNDSFPTVNLEALACGTPVITYRTGGSPEAIDETTGIVVEKGNVKDLAKGINHITDSRLYTSDNCRKRAEILFNQDIQFNKYIDLYTELLNI